MSLKTLGPQLIISPALRALVRSWHAARRRISGRKPVFHAFVERDDPYSHLLVQALPRIADAHGANIVWHEVGAPDRSAAPEPEKLADWAREDARTLADAYGLDPDTQEFPPCEDRGSSEALRARLGHYGSAMTWFEGEWYWAIDRLNHLEQRLGSEPVLFPAQPETAKPSGSDGDCEIEVFLSLRSPYSYLAVMRMFELAADWNARLVLRPVLPMVMRSLPVPRAKRFYIVRDCKREAERLGLPFGKISDPVGPGVERGLAILCKEIADGRGERFLKAFMTAVWADGIDAATDAGLRKICAAGGVDWKQARSALANDSWRDIVEGNREALFEHGHWGVPTFRCRGKMAFGQDRLWLVGRWLGAR